MAHQDDPHVEIQVLDREVDAVWVCARNPGRRIASVIMDEDEKQPWTVFEEKPCPSMSTHRHYHIVRCTHAMSQLVTCLIPADGVAAEESAKS